MLNLKYIPSVDPEVAAIIEKEAERQEGGLELIAATSGSTLGMYFKFNILSSKKS